MNKGGWSRGREGKLLFSVKRSFPLPRTPTPFKKSGVFEKGIIFSAGGYFCYLNVSGIKAFQEKRSI
jgi:hypothetical protein